MAKHQALTFYYLRGKMQEKINDCHAGAKRQGRAIASHTAGAGENFMPITLEFLKEALSTEDELDVKITKILSEYQADVDGLKLNRDTILQEKKDLEGKLSGFDAKETEYKKQISDLSEKIKKAGSEETKDFYEAEKKRITEEYEKTKTTLEAERDKYREEAMNFYRNDEFEKAIKELKAPVRQELFEDLRSLFYLRNPFDRKLIDGTPKFLNSESRTVKDVLGSYFQTDAGKVYLTNGNSGGGASGSGSGGGSRTTKPWKDMSLGEQTKLMRTSPDLARQLRDAGKE